MIRICIYVFDARYLRDRAALFSARLLFRSSSRSDRFLLDLFDDLEGGENVLKLLLLCDCSCNNK